MPVHFESYIKNGSNENEILAEVNNIIEKPDAVYMVPDGKKVLVSQFLKDKNDSNKRIGKIVVTIVTNDEKKINEIVDVDLTLDSNKAVTLSFDRILKESSISNEYYDVSASGVHFQIETVDRYMVNEPGLMNCEIDANLSLFPFKMNAFDTLDELNEAIGFRKPVELGAIHEKVHGLAEDFFGVGGMILGVEEPCSVLIGKVESFKEVKCDFGKKEIEFTVIYLNTALGVLPVAANRNNFYLDNMKVGSYIMMFADVKADFKQ